MLRVLLFWILIGSLVISDSARAQSDQVGILSTPENIDLSTRIQHGRPLFFSVAGAISLGTYQAGFIDYGIAWAKENKILDLRGVIGTSAGSINALLSIMYACGKPLNAISDSATWKIWIDTGIDDLYKREEVSETSIFSRSHTRRVSSLSEDLWMQGLASSCDVVLGITTSRLNPFYEDFKFGMSIPRMDETFLIRVRGQGFGVPPLVSNYFDYQSGGMQVGLPLTDDARENFRLIIRLILSSSSVPIAFDPVNVPHCFYKSGDEKFKCEGENVFNAMFMDGGFFKNNPLHSAYRVFINRLGKIAPDNVVFGAVDPQIKGFPVQEQISLIDLRSGFFSLVRTLLKNLVTTARMKDVSNLTQTFPDIKWKLLHSANLYPVVGELGSYFLGFFDRDFRIFDYLMGAYDAKKGLQFWMQATRHRESILPDVTSPGNWELLSCNEYFLEGRAENLEVCRKGAGSSFENLKILYQVSLNRLYSNCAGLKNIVVEHHEHCIRGLRGEVPPKLVENFDEASWKRQLEENEIEYVGRLLGDYGYEYKDLGLLNPNLKKVSRR